MPQSCIWCWAAAQGPGPQPAQAPGPGSHPRSPRTPRTSASWSTCMQGCRCTGASCSHHRASSSGCPRTCSRGFCTPPLAGPGAGRHELARVQLETRLLLVGEARVHDDLRVRHRAKRDRDRGRHCERPEPRGPPPPARHRGPRPRPTALRAEAPAAWRYETRREALSPRGGRPPTSTPEASRPPT